MANKHASLDALFADIADAIREKTGDEEIIPAVEFPNMIRNRLELIPSHISYLTFSSPNSFTLAVGDATKHWDGTMEYSTDASTWSTWDGMTTLSSATSGSDNVLYLRGTGNTKIGYLDEDYTLEYIPWVINGTDVRCDGNIEALLDYATVEAGQHPTMAGDCFAGLFMGCTALITPPALPATTLATYCYAYMFQGCTSLTQAPALPATTLASECYYYMFYGCTALTQAPALPATTLAAGCYNGMFESCTSLTQAPSLPATTLEILCYQHMFNGCSALTQVPALPATTLEIYCYAYMFDGCTSLKFSTTKTDEYTQEYRIPSSGTGTTTTNALSDMFASTGGTFKGTPKINTTYYLSNTNTVVS